MSHEGRDQDDRPPTDHANGEPRPLREPHCAADRSWRVRIRWITYVLLFMATSAAAIKLLSRDFRPMPVYRTLRWSADDPFIAIAKDTPLRIDIPLESRKPDAVEIPIVWRGAKLNFLAVVDDSVEIVTTSASANNVGDALRIDLPGIPADAAMLTLTFSCDDNNARKAPRFMRSQEPSIVAAKALLGSAELTDCGPIVTLRYPWKSRMALFGWVVVLPIYVLVRRRRRQAPLLLSAICLCAMVTSVMLWQQNYRVHYGHWVADGYNECAEHLAQWLTRPEQRSASAEWLAHYPHTLTAAVPALLAPFVAAGVPVEIAFLAFSTWCSFAAVLLVYRIAFYRMNLRHDVALILAMLMACHLLMLRTFARPVTDAAGLALLIWTLDLLLGRLHAVSAAATFALAVNVFLHPLTRPQGIAFVACIAVAVVIVDSWRVSRFSMRNSAATILKVIVLPSLVYAGLFAYFGWSHNFELMMAKSQRWKAAHSVEMLFPAAVGLLQFVPILWLTMGRRAGRRTSIILALWVLFYTALLFVVESPFWMRYLLPLLPAVVLLAGQGLQNLSRRNCRRARAVLLTACALNVAAVVYQIYLPAEPPSQIMHYISSS